MMEKLDGLGPKSWEMLTAAGINSADQLRGVGSVAAFAAARRANTGVSLKLLWAIEGALTGQSWQEVARLHRTSLLLALEAYEKSNV
jgi:DNA transformation protein and related proteins